MCAGPFLCVDAASKAGKSALINSYSQLGEVKGAFIENGRRLGRRETTQIDRGRQGEASLSRVDTLFEHWR
ncbi:hypothetical protein SHA02_12320 [Salisediminibacterium halotolerans]|nr:hypothetical protein SHA02_12320 [Salisediminibacterium halotolerans]